MNRLMLPFLVFANACAVASAQTVYDTLGSWRGHRSDRWENAAQTFTSPAGDTTLSTFSLGVGGSGGGTYSVALYRWDRSGQHAVGPALFTRPAQGVPEDLAFVEFPVGAPLVGGADYAVITSLSKPDGNGVAFSDTNPFRQGDVAFGNGTIFDSWRLRDGGGVFTGFDLAFRAVFIPEPQCLGVLVLAGLIARRVQRRHVGP